MKTVHMLGDRKVEVVDVPEPEPRDDLVVVKIMSSVLCGSEAPAYHLPTGMPGDGGSGHEAAGVVWRTDRPLLVKEGDRVSIFPTYTENCHRCPACLSGEWLLCHNPMPRRSTAGWGTHSQFMLVPEYLCLPLPDDLSFDIGAMISDCIGTPYRAIRRLGIEAGNTVLVTGAGPIGAAAAIIAKYRNAKVISVDVNDYRLAQAQENGADHVFNPSRDDVLARVREITGRGVEAAVECSGTDDARTQCLDAVAPGGSVAFLGLKSPEVKANMLQHFTSKELTLIGSWASTPPEHFQIVGLIQGGMPAGKLITHRYGIDDAATAFRKFFDGETVKVALDMWGEQS